MKALISRINLIEIPFLLIGGRGLEAHGYVRNTKDVDLLISLANRATLSESLRDLGYACIAETAIFSRWRASDPASDDVDLLYVDPSTFSKLDSDAVSMPLGTDLIRVPSVAGMIALKLHAIRNNPERRQRDVSDIRAILTLHPDTVPLEELKNLCDRYGPPGIIDDLRRNFT